MGLKLVSIASCFLVYSMLLLETVARPRFEDNIGSRVDAVHDRVDDVIDGIGGIRFEGVKNRISHDRIGDIEDRIDRIRERTDHFGNDDIIHDEDRGDDEAPQGRLFGYFEGNGTGIGDYLSSAITKVGSAVRTGTDAIKGAVRVVTDPVTSAIGTVTNPIGEIIGAATDKAKSMAINYAVYQLTGMKKKREEELEESSSVLI